MTKNEFNLKKAELAVVILNGILSNSTVLATLEAENIKMEDMAVKASEEILKLCNLAVTEE